MRATVELVKDLNGRLTPEADVNIRAAALGMMHDYAELTGLPKPQSVLARRRARAAFSSANTASEDFIRESIEYPTILPEWTSFTAQR